MDSVENIIKQLSIEEKVAQLFITTPENLVRKDKPVVNCDKVFEQSIMSVPVGGILYFGRNLVSPYQTKEMLRKTQNASLEAVHIPLFQCVDEEGGDISKVANNDSFGVKNVGTPRDLARTGSTTIVKGAGAYIGAYLSELGFNVDFAPCSDVLTNEKNTVIGNRSFGNVPGVVTEMSQAFADGLISKNIIPAFKHFPGHGATEGDSHLGYAYTNKTLRSLKECELIPFTKAIEMNYPMIMVGHISLPNATTEDVPASLSKEIITGLIRNQLGYEGVIITDSLKMKAISDVYSPKEAALKVLDAGADLLLRPIDFYEAYSGVVEEAKLGRLSEKRINESLKRVLRLKKNCLLNS